MAFIKNYCFTVDDNIRFLKEITENHYQSIFDHPYLAMYRRLHEEFGLMVQLNLFYRMEDFDLSQVSEAYYAEWEANSDWLKLSFHSELENVKPYETSDYDEVYEMIMERFPEHPKVFLLAPVCRPGWLVEMECMAVKQNQ